MNGKFTFTIIKPNAVANGNTGHILAMINDAGYRIAGLKMTNMRRKEAEVFYGMHREKPFFQEVVSYMISGPIVVAVLEKENAVEDYRKFIGATNPANAAEGTIRKMYGTDVMRNAVHGSDSDENAQREANFFFALLDQYTSDGYSMLTTVEHY